MLNSTTFTADDFCATFKSTRAVTSFRNSLEGYVENIKAALNADTSVQDLFFAPNKIESIFNQGVYVELGYLVAALNDCVDQLPLSITNLRNLLDKKDYGLFDTFKFQNDIEVAFPEDAVSDAGLHYGSLVLKGGRHRLALILSVLTMAGVDVNSVDIQNASIRVTASTFSDESIVPTLQVLSNTSRTMGVAEKAFGKATRLDIEVSSPDALIEAMSVTHSATTRTDLYRTLFSICVRNDAQLTALTSNTLADIGASYFTNLKKLSTDKITKKQASFSYGEYDVEMAFHLSKYDAILTQLPLLIQDYAGQNMARSARDIGAKLAARVLA